VQSRTENELQKGFQALKTLPRSLDIASKYHAVAIAGRRETVAALDVQVKVAEAGRTLAAIETVSRASLQEPRATAEKMHATAGELDERAAQALREATGALKRAFAEGLVVASDLPITAQARHQQRNPNEKARFNARGGAAAGAAAAAALSQGR
jgi:hypothetical protein